MPEAADPKRLQASFFCDDAVFDARDVFFPKAQLFRKQIGVDIKTVEFGWPIGMPVCRPLGDGLYEVRSSLS